MTAPVDVLASKIANRTCRYGIIGLGYVGLPLAIAFTKKGSTSSASRSTPRR